jgi:protein-S-isoprenylcysteine O-methyltransferase Ste14
MKPESSSCLVVSGVYTLTRNPMYLDLLLVLIGWAVFLSNALAFLVRFQIEPEGEAMKHSKVQFKSLLKA